MSVLVVQVPKKKKELAKEIREKAAPLLNWLRTAEEESSSDDDDDVEVSECVCVTDRGREPSPLHRWSTLPRPLGTLSSRQRARLQKWRKSRDLMWTLMPSDPHPPLSLSLTPNIPTTAEHVALFTVYIILLTLPPQTLSHT